MKRKVKKFSEGGDYESSDDAKNLLAAAEREAADAAPKVAPSTPAEPMKMASFGEAFKEARGRGDKTFEYMGKKYTTEMAKPKAAAATPAPRTAMQKRAEKQTTARDTRRDTPSIFSKLKSMASNPMNPRILRERNAIDKQADMDASSRPMKKGGSVKSSASSRADGIAMRGKTRGKVI